MPKALRLSVAVPIAVGFLSLAGLLKHEAFLAQVLPGSLDLERDGDIELREVFAVLIGVLEGMGSWLFSAAYRKASAILMLFSLGVGWLVVLALRDALVSRIVITFLMSEERGEDSELSKAMVLAVKRGQLSTARRLRLAGRVQDEALIKPPRMVKLRPLQPWKKSEGSVRQARSEPARPTRGCTHTWQQAAARLTPPLQEAELDHYELDLDQRYTSTLCMWVPDREPAGGSDRAAEGQRRAEETGGHIAAISAWQLLLDVMSLALLSSTEPPPRVYFSCTSADGTCRCTRARLIHHPTETSANSAGAAPEWPRRGLVPPTDRPTTGGRISMLRFQRGYLRPILENARETFHATRKGETLVRRLVTAYPPHYFPPGDSESRRALESFALPAAREEREQVPLQLLQPLQPLQL